MGMFDNKKKSNNNFNKCSCHHCRGGHGFDDLDFTNGQDYDIESQIASVDFETDDPEDLIQQYIEAVLECDNEEEVEEVMYEFFDEVYTYTVKEVMMTEIEAKIMALNMLKESIEEDDDY